MYEGSFLDNEKFPELNRKVNELAENYQVANSAITIAWILRHPAKIQAIVGTTNWRRLVEICAARGEPYP
jgi:predicted oxidoreductase